LDVDRRRRAHRRAAVVVGRHRCLEVVRGAGKTPDGRPATALDVIVNGWPVRILVASQELPHETIAMLGAFAPVGHPLRASLRVTQEPACGDSRT